MACVVMEVGTLSSAGNSTATQPHRSLGAKPCAEILRGFFPSALVIKPHGFPGVVSSCSTWLLGRSVGGRAADRAFGT